MERIPPPGQRETFVPVRNDQQTSGSLNSFKPRTFPYFQNIQLTHCLFLLPSPCSSSFLSLFHSLPTFLLKALPPSIPTQKLHSLTLFFPDAGRSVEDGVYIPGSIAQGSLKSWMKKSMSV